MMEQEFTHAVLEELFVQGLNCPNVPLLSIYAQLEREHLGTWPDPRTFAEKCVQFPGVTIQPRMLDRTPSRTAGACEKWLAVHEAGHAIVGVSAGLFLKGV